MLMICPAFFQSDCQLVHLAIDEQVSEHDRTIAVGRKELGDGESLAVFVDQALQRQRLVVAYVDLRNAQAVSLDLFDQLCTFGGGVIVVRMWMGRKAIPL